MIFAHNEVGIIYLFLDLMIESCMVIVTCSSSYEGSHNSSVSRMDSGYSDNLAGIYSFCPVYVVIRCLQESWIRGTQL